MDVSADNDNPLEVDDNHSTILRVSSPWPAGTKQALRTSLDRGIFEDIRVAVPSGPESAEQPIYFAGTVDERVGTSISRSKVLIYLSSEPMINQRFSSFSVGIHLSAGRWNITFDVGDECSRSLLCS